MREDAHDGTRGAVTDRPTPADTDRYCCTVSGRPETLVVALAELVADATDQSPTHLRPVYDVVDPAALAGLVGAEGDLETEFTYEGCQVSIDGDGHLVVDPSGA